MAEERLFLASIAGIVGGVMVTSSGIGADATYPAGLYTGPILTVAGVVLAVIVVRNWVAKDDELP